MAVAAHPQAPSNDYGRQAWLREKLQSDGGHKVSTNSVHKWMTGSSKPREDTVRALAQVLSVDEAWLSVGSIPQTNVHREEHSNVPPVTSRGPVLMLAGLIEMEGGRVLFPDRSATYDLKINLGDMAIDLVIAHPEKRGGRLDMIFREPVGDARIIAVILTPDGECSARLRMFDLTHLPRKMLGGYSLLAARMRDDGRLKVDEVRPLVGWLKSVAELVPGCCP